MYIYIYIYIYIYTNHTIVGSDPGGRGRGGLRGGRLRGGPRGGLRDLGGGGKVGNSKDTA